MPCWQPNSFVMSNRVPELYDFSLPFLERRGPLLRRERSRYSQLLPFTRPNNWTKQKRRNNVHCRDFGPPNLLKTSRSRPSNSHSEDYRGSRALTDSSTDSDSDDESVSILIEPGESYASECDIEINVEDIGVDTDNDSINYILNDSNPLEPDRDIIEYDEVLQINMPRVFLRVDYVPSRQDKQLVNKLIRHARANKLPIMEDLLCPDCRLIPKEPVTGLCGHTRCMNCIISVGPCPCGMVQPHELHVNILVKHIIEKMISHYDVYDAVLVKEPLIDNTTSLQRANELDDPVPIVYANANTSDVETRYFTMTMKARFDMARRFIWFGYHIGAIPHLAHVAASQGIYWKYARSLLSECVAIVSGIEQDRFYLRKLYRSVRGLSASSWLAKVEIECILCVDFFRDPITTYCGHTYCRSCLLRSYNYSPNCPLCKRPLNGLDVYGISETLFVTSILHSMDPDNGPVSLEPDMVPLLMCAVALPTVPCPLFIIDARYWRSLSRLLAVGGREFGMTARVKDNAMPEFGTMLEIRDCIELQNGGAILSTVGKWRFKITQTDFMHGCDVARVERLCDLVPQDPTKIHHLQTVAANVANKANRWLSKMDVSIYYEIEKVYGHIPMMGYDLTNWWESDDGPNWVWWLISILPLKSPIKILIFSAQCVMKRLIAVDMTLNTLDFLCKMNNVRKRKRIPSN